MKTSYSKRAAILSASSTLALLGCSNSNSPELRPSATPNGAPVTEFAVQKTKIPLRRELRTKNPKKLARNIARLSMTYKPEDPVPIGNCGFTNKKLQPIYDGKPPKFIVNTLCQAPLGQPASLQAEPTLGSAKTGEVSDGDVVRALCREDGQETFNNARYPGGNSDTWINVRQGQQEGFISEVNLGFVKDSLIKAC